MKIAKRDIKKQWGTLSSPYVNKEQKHRRIFNLCAFMVTVLIIISLSPLVIPEHTPEPFLFYLPRTLWSGFATYILIVALTFTATRFHTEDNPKDEEKE